EYRYLKKLHNLHELNPGLFKWARTRPANFPTLRLAQLAAIGSRWSGFFRKLLEEDSNFLSKFFETLNIHPYWKEHYRFEEKAKNPYVRVGQTTQNLIAINAIAPLLFAYGKHTGDEKLTDKSLEILNSLKGEKNHITRLYAQYRWHAQSAFESQGLLHLKKNYCDKKKCLHCTIGHFWLKRQA
ncbi:MAG: DUF2851 family protein, partial [Chitinophagales bacterium]|nr:DUF2851 family protein [Chitinophagales bacterium]